MKARMMPLDMARRVWRFTHSLSFKLSFYAGLIMFLALLAFAYHSIRAQERNLMNEEIQGALKDSEVVKAAIWNSMMTKDREVVREIVRAVGARREFARIEIFDKDGRLRYASYDRDSGEPRSNRGAPNPTGKPVDTLRRRISPDGEWLYVENPLLNTPGCSTAACHAHPPSEKVLGTLSLSIPLRDMQARIYSTARTTIVFAFLLFVLISSIIGLAVLFLVNPHLKRLRERAARIGRGDFDSASSTVGSDELGDLSRSFDLMSRRISEREMWLDERRKLYKSLFEEVPCYLTVVSRDYKIVRANKAFRTQFGDQEGKHCFVGYKGLNERCAQCPVEKTFQDGLSHKSEETWRLNDREAYVIVETAPIVDDEGRITEVLEMSVDITELKQLQIELQKKQHEYKTLFEDVPCYLTVIDRDFKIIQANRVFEDDFGAKVGLKCFRAYKNRSHKCDNCPVERTFKDGRSHTSEEVWRRNGEETHIIVNTAPIRDESGAITAVMEMSANVTEIKRLQAELAELGETVAGMSHTIKNILGGLQGGVYIVDSGLQKDSRERIEQGWTVVKKNVGKISELVRGILYASKERQPEYEESDPAVLLSDICDLYQERAETDGVSLVRQFEPSMEHVFMEPAGIHTVLSNLVSNAIEACRNDGDRRHTVTVAGIVENGLFIIQVEDDGPGIREEVKEKLFGKFYSTKGAKGTGLGLVMTKKIVREHGGRIHVDSEPGRGTCFSIEIPVRPSSREQPLDNAV